MDGKNRPRSGSTDLARVNRAAKARCIHAHVELGGEKGHQDRHRPNVDLLTLHRHVPYMNEGMGEKVVSSRGTMSAAAQKSAFNLRRNYGNICRANPLL